jgi:hypothetical protein
MENRMNHLCMDLKVCEGCGGLWIRAGVAEGVYCRRCVARLAELPQRRPRGKAKLRSETGQGRGRRQAQGWSGVGVVLAGGSR